MEEPNRSTSIPSPLPLTTQKLSLPPRDPITCHVLDLTTGSPAPSVSVSLTLLKPLGPSAPFTALTSRDGRVSNWNAQEGPSLTEIFDNLREHVDGRMMWSLRFETGSYFGEGKTFYPEVEIKFFVERGSGHYHVPVLLGPWGYTTYRGS
ncbi:hypothetical protein MMC12_008012 [Toensbergia leucococca]|nr:hypothetical protein [Toensbergia leucococca]